MRNPTTTPLVEVHPVIAAVWNLMRTPAILMPPHCVSTPVALLAVLLFGLAASDVRAQEEPMVLAGLVVSDGSITFGALSTTECFPITGLNVGGVMVTVHTSKWQRSATADDAWEDVPGTEETGQVCPLSPEEPGDYRLIIDGTIDGERGLYRSNVFTKTEVPVLPGVAAVWLALLLAGLLLRARRTALVP